MLETMAIFTLALINFTIILYYIVLPLAGIYTWKKIMKDD